MHRWKALAVKDVCVSLAMLGALVWRAEGAVTTVGAVPNAPPAGGGAVSGLFTVGEAAFGSVTVAGGTPITSNGLATLGNGAAGIGQVSLGGFGSNWTIGGSTSDLILGDEGVGLVTLSSSALLTVPDDTIIGSQTSSSGKLVVAGLGSVFDSGDDLTLGSSGFGVVEITAGGGLDSDAVVIGDSSAGRGLATIANQQSRWTATLATIGDVGHGQISLSDGGRFVATGNTVVGAAQGGVGVVDVVGVGSLYAHSGPNFTLGSAGAGELRIRDGGLLMSASTVTVAATATAVGTATVSGTGARMDITGSLSTGSGEAVITISNGGVVSTTGSSVVSSTGRVTLAGGRWESVAAANDAISVSGLLTGSGMLNVQGVTIAGGASHGRLQAQSGDHLVVTGTLTNSGLVDLPGGEMEIGGVATNNGDIDLRDGASLRIGGAGLDNNSGSQLAITSGSVDVYGAVDNNSGAEITVAGGATGVFHDAVTNNGTLFVAASSEVVMLENMGFAAGSTLSIELAKTNSAAAPTDAFGLVSISGAANMSGTIKVALASGFVASVGETFEVLRASGGRTGTFATETLPAIGFGMALDVQYTANSVLLAVVATPGLAGDYNNNGVVDAGDFVVWRNNLGQSVTLPNDTTPGSVAQADYNVWRTNFGKVAGSGMGAAAALVPEPVSLSMLGLVWGIGWCGFWKRKYVGTRC